VNLSNLGFCWEGFVTVSVSLLVIDLFKLFMSSGSILVDCMCQEIYPFFSWFFQFAGVYTFSKYSCMIWISLVSVVLSPFSSLILLIWIFFFLLINLAKGLSILFMFSKNQLLVSLVHFTFFLVSVSLISSLISILFFHLLLLRLVCSYFSKSLRHITRLFIWDLIFWSS
jgi:hypothetical protein